MPAASSRASRKGTATYAMMMDDDVVCEPEGIIRAVTFGDLAKRPTIVGGHMFNLYSRAAAALLRRDRPAVALLVADAASTATPQWDFARPQPALVALAAQARRRRLQRLVHVPDPARSCSRRSGLSLPVFIKWDDSEFGLRAKAAGYPTVSFPGAAVWHVPWTDKNDGARLAVLLPPPQPDHRGAAALAVRARRPDGAREPQPPDQAPRVAAVLDGGAAPPGDGGRAARTRTRSTASSPTKLADINAFRKQFSDAQLHADRDDLPPVRRKKPPKKGKADIEIPGRPQHADHRGAGADPPAAAGARDGDGVPRDRAHRDGRRVVQPRRSTTRSWCR